MKQFCDACKVSLEEHISHCPLCGKCVNESLVDKKDSHENFPSDEQFKKEKKEALRAIVYMILLGNFLASLTELLLFKTYTWSLHVLVASTFGLFGIIIPIKNNWYLVNYHSIFYICFTLYIIFLENYTNSFGWGITYVIPLFCLGFGLYNFIMVINNIKTKSDYILPMIILFIISTISFSINYYNDLTIWPSLSSFLTLISVTFICFAFRSSKLVKALSRKFHI